MQVVCMSTIVGVMQTDASSYNSYVESLTKLKPKLKSLWRVKLNKNEK